jgi:hypothetical protein
MQVDSAVDTKKPMGTLSLTELFYQKLMFHGMKVHAIGIVWMV